MGGRSTRRAPIWALALIIVLPGPLLSACDLIVSGEATSRTAQGIEISVTAAVQSALDAQGAVAPEPSTADTLATLSVPARTAIVAQATALAPQTAVAQSGTPVATPTSTPTPSPIDFPSLMLAAEAKPSPTVTPAPFVATSADGIVTNKSFNYAVEIPVGWTLRGDTDKWWKMDSDDSTGFRYYWSIPGVNLSLAEFHDRYGLFLLDTFVEAQKLSSPAIDEAFSSAAIDQRFVQTNFSVCCIKGMSGNYSVRSSISGTNGLVRIFGFGQ